MKYVNRAITNKILTGLRSIPAVFINGPRQAGKSTLVQHIAEYSKASYMTLDDMTTLAAAESDPEGFIQGLDYPVIVDEIQLVPHLARAIKKRIDELRQIKSNTANGAFILTGSANIIAVPQLAEALVGRVAIFTLYPLSVSEYMHKSSHFIENCFSGKFPSMNFKQSIPIQELIQYATFPEIALNKQIDKAVWLNAYLSTVLQRDIRNLAQIEKISILPNIMNLIASRIGALVNDNQFARDIDMNVMTWRRYRNLLEQLFLLQMIPAWHRNLGKRLVKSPKCYLIDTLMLCDLLGLGLNKLRDYPRLYGAILENFVAMELLKLLSLYEDSKLYHYRSHDYKEIDFIIERHNHQLIAIEVKSKATVTEKDFKVIKELQKSANKDFVCGIVLYQGKNLIPFGDNIFAVPINALWE